MTSKNDMPSRNSGHELQMRKSVNELNLSPNNNSGEEGGQYSGDHLSKDFTLNIANLNKIDEKLTALADCLKKQNIGTISQFCSDWWELTDEEEYQVNSFMKAYADERLKRDFKQLISLEILSIAVVNYFTSSPEIFRPSNIQMNQVRTLLQAMHHNFLCSVEIILQKLQPEQQNA